MSNLQTFLDASVRYDQNLTASEKLLYSELTARMDENKLCSLTNQEVASLYKVSLCTASHWFKSLISYGFVKVIKTSPRLLEVCTPKNTEPAVNEQPTPLKNHPSKKARPSKVSSQKKPADFHADLLAAFKANHLLTPELLAKESNPKVDDIKANFNPTKADVKVDAKFNEDTLKANFNVATPEHKADFNPKTAEVKADLTNNQGQQLGLTKLIGPLVTKLVAWFTDLFDLITKFYPQSQL